MLFQNPLKCADIKAYLDYDEACVEIFNSLFENITIYGQYEQCHKCNYQNLTTVNAQKSGSLLVSTRSPLGLSWSVDSSNTCQFTKLFYEHFRYGWNITSECEPNKDPFYIKEAADDAYLPILMAFVVLFCFGTMWYMVKCIYKNSGRLRQLISWSTEFEEDLTGSAPLVVERPPSIKKHPHRVKAIDVFRGLCIILMIFINYGGGNYWFFQHSVWNGITVADLVFPWFMWIMGLSLTISLQKKLLRAVPRRTIVFQIIRRSLILIFLGVVINSSHHEMTVDHLRLPGVLQRFGFTYFIVGMLEIIFTKRIEIETMHCVSDISMAWAQWLFVLTLISIHTCVTFLANVPNCGKGYLGPGGLDEMGMHINCTGGVAGYIDRQVFGKHLLRSSQFQKVYESKVLFDPEGILSTLASVLTVYLGVQAGRTLNTYQNVKHKMIRWSLWGIILIIVGAGLCAFKRDDGPIPLNKQLWSLSFSFLTGGMAFLIFGFLFLIVDILKKWGGRPFFYPGMNAIALYVGHMIFKNTFPFGWIPNVETHAAYLFMNLWGTALWVAIAIYFYKHDIFFTI
ncbi:heparan-alpha-glucosaminide N-acetyltransferase-like [Anthonomus grandis grandis]|uniref:heparan-alpha-glucosaminide N-acetyltransferase-like n=1 Tax=Anthonomus grandis grandis TaxID=2921223 RepID=UPI002165D1B4|nr:heparan-alpha-glucosaminide N-acetyltransferase-like [Anthonomus grandis grandis]XP_050301074.1 heparan-alpha-glucosaminide N-acetyltransferase-like [Anthonomus grandis grandis]XP_050301081.1 heparan-alpha-glucosaminide N-acetyltransferase-like [Anthonomus grandis grandis]